MTDAPPTAGLPLRAGDLAPWGSADLAGALARWLGVPAVQLECSGTSALMVALAALRRLAPARDEVVIPAYTCPLVLMAVAQSGLRARLCDLRPDVLDMDPAHLATLCGERTLAVLPTHLCGRVADVGAALARARAMGAYVIEDAAQALGARADGAPVGWQGDVGFYSLAVGKGLTTFEGGVLLARDPALRAALQEESRASVRPSLAWELRRSAELLGYALLYTRAAWAGLMAARCARRWRVATGCRRPATISARSFRATRWAPGAAAWVGARWRGSRVSSGNWPIRRRSALRGSLPSTACRSWAMRCPARRGRGPCCCCACAAAPCAMRCCVRTGAMAWALRRPLSMRCPTTAATARCPMTCRARATGPRASWR